MSSVIPRPVPKPCDLFGHPSAVAVLSGTELGTSHALSGVQALLLLYMVDALFVSGHEERIAGFATYRAVVEGVTGPLSTRALATQTFGIFGALTYLAPLVGGWIGDGRVGRRAAIIVGGVLMTAGYVALASDEAFLGGLLLVVMGRAGYNGNVVPQLSATYANDDRRSADGMQIYYTMVNLGAFLGPLILGANAVARGFHSSFLVAAVSMTLGLSCYLGGLRRLPLDRARKDHEVRPPLTRDERRRILVLLAILPLSTVVWIAQTQVWNVYNLWANDHVDLVILGWTVPVPWFQAFDSLAPLVMVPFLIAMWRSQAKRKREPDEIGKMTIGALLFALGMLWLAASPLVADARGKVPLLWALAFHVISNAGWLYYVPLATSLYAKCSPAKATGVMVAVSWLAISFASLVSGRLGVLYEKVSPTSFWLVHAALVGAGGLVFATAKSRLRRALAMVGPTSTAAYST